MEPISLGIYLSVGWDSEALSFKENRNVKPRLLEQGFLLSSICHDNVQCTVFVKRCVWKCLQDIDDRQRNSVVELGGQAQSVHEDGLLEYLEDSSDVVIVTV